MKGCGYESYIGGCAYIGCFINNRDCFVDVRFLLRRRHASAGFYIRYNRHHQDPGGRDRLHPLEGFSYPTVVSQFHHLIAAERYWLGVLQGRIVLDEDAADHTTIQALRTLRAEVESATAAYLEASPDEVLSTSQKVTMWNGDQADLVPARVVVRTQVHIYQHHGEIASMSRLLGYAFPPGLDFPLR